MCIFMSCTWIFFFFFFSSLSFFFKAPTWILFVLRLGRCRVSCLGQAEHFFRREPGIY